MSLSTYCVEATVFVKAALALQLCLLSSAAAFMKGKQLSAYSGEFIRQPPGAPVAGLGPALVAFFLCHRVINQSTS